MKQDQEGLDLLALLARLDLTHPLKALQERQGARAGHACQRQRQCQSRQLSASSIGYKLRGLSAPSERTCLSCLL